MYIVDFAKSLFRKANAGVIVYLVLNILVYVTLLGGFSNVGLAGVGILVYLITLCIALSPVGEFIMRLQNGCKKIKRKDYLDRLMPLFEEVYAQAKAKDPTISDSVRLFMSGSKSPNAFATGRKTICLTKGFLTYTDEQIKGTLAHEFAHLANKDTDLLLLISVGNFLMSAVFVIWRVIINIIVFIFATALRMSFLGTFFTSLFINLLLTFFMWLWTKIGMLLVMHSSRQNEFEADRFAFELGYGNDLCVVLDSFDDGEDSEGRSLWSQLRSTHPSVDDRVGRLQELGAQYTNMYGHNVHAVNLNPHQYGYAHNSPPPPLPAAGGGYHLPGPAQKQGAFPVGAAAFVDHARPRAHSVIKRDALVCGKCYEALPEDSKFCAKCGTAAPPPQPEPMPLGQQINCAKCGAYIAPDDAFCAECGSPKPVPPPPLPALAPLPILCIRCGTEIAPDDSFCSECGANKPAPIIQLIPEKVFCISCSAEIPEGRKFCAKCGTAVVVAPPPPPEPPPEPPPITCAGCGCVPDAGAAFCADCGMPVGAPVASVPALRVCSGCGITLEPDDVFCADCGTRN
ncbi:MAG: zinc ribbon domain-containing protein [Oscillospiraceae bacterium]|nr:zinc ribbon domain-containing protein [Oscillospiraceae bacterium]